MSSGVGNGFLFSSRYILPLHPLHCEIFPNIKTSQNGVVGAAFVDLLEIDVVVPVVSCNENV